MNGNVLAGLLGLVSLMATTPAQQRAPFTGVVRDEAGKPLANAQVVCDWTSNGIALGASDRCEAKTDAEGRFALDLWIGHAYCVWAIGPATADKPRLAVAPSFAAVGGKSLDLVAVPAPDAPRLRISGSQPWLKQGPLALRLYVAAGHALTDVVIPGDGEVPLPTLPTPHLAVSLVDARGDQLDWRSIDVRESTECTFQPTESVEFATVDDDGKAVAGARVLANCWVQHAIAPPLLSWGAVALPRRVVATSDANGIARARIVRSSEASTTLFHAIAPNGASTVSGWWGEHRIIDGAVANTDADRVVLTLHRRESAVVTVRGRTPDLLLQGVWTGNHRFGGPTMSAVMPLATEAAALADEPSCVMFSADVMRLDIGGVGSGALPLRIFARAAGPKLPLPAIDLAALRSLHITVVDEHGAPAPFTLVGLNQTTGGFPVTWLTEIVTDDRGRAELRCPVEAAELYAVTGSSHGCALAAGTGAADVRIQLQPFGSARFQVVDAAGKPVAGARLHTRARIGCDQGIARLAQGSRDPIEGKTTDAQGVAAVRLPREFADNTEVIATWRDKASPATKLRGADGEVLLLRLPE